MEVVRGSCKKGKRGCEIDKDLPYGICEVIKMNNDKVKRECRLRKAA